MPASYNGKYVRTLRRLTFFHTSNIGSVGQRALKLLAIKVGGVKKVLWLRPLQPKCVEAQVARVRVEPQSNLLVCIV